MARLVIQTGEPMGLKMASPTKHPKTGTYRVRIAIPAHLRETTARLYGRRAEFIESLGTKDAREARGLADAASGRLSRLLKNPGLVAG